MLTAGAELVSRVDDLLLAPQEQTGQFARLQEAALAVLSGDTDTDLERRPLMLIATGERVPVRLIGGGAGHLQQPLLPRIEIQSRMPCKGYSFTPQSPYATWFVLEHSLYRAWKVEESRALVAQNPVPHRARLEWRQDPPPFRPSAHLLAHVLCAAPLSA